MSVVIRHATVADLPGILALYNHEIRTGVATFDVDEKDLAERALWLADHDARHPVLVADVDGLLCGWASLNRYSDRAAYARTVENSVYVAAEHQGRGHGTRLLAALLNQARTIGHHVILARITNGNAASVALHRHYGFTPVGMLREVGWKFDSWHDVLLMQATLP